MADAVTDLARQEIFMKTAVVEKKRLVGVFTKCDMLHDADEVNIFTNPQNPELLYSRFVRLSTSPMVLANTPTSPCRMAGLL